MKFSKVEFLVGAFMLAGTAAAASAALPAVAQVDVGQASALRQLVPADELEGAANQQYAQMMADSSLALARRTFHDSSSSSL